MGYGRWSASAWSSYSAGHAGKSASAIFTASGMEDRFNPKLIQLRDSRDSADNPLSTPIILASDVTGSMGVIAETMIRSGLDTAMREIYKRKPVTDPHVMVMAVGDAECDRAPLQVSQFEADIRLAEQLSQFWIEGGGGGNGGESYHLPWYFAGTRVAADAFEKRNRKGYLFTIGDEPILRGLSAAHIEQVFGGRATRNLTSADMLAMASRHFEVFHIVLTDTGYASGALDQVMRTWKPLLGQRVLACDDHTRVAEVIVSAIQVNEGLDVNTVAGSWDAATGATIRKAVRTLAPPKPATGGLLRFFA
jgi:hypothetical protein